VTGTRVPAKQMAPCRMLGSVEMYCFQSMACLMLKSSVHRTRVVEYASNARSNRGRFELMFPRRFLILFAAEAKSEVI
jgi:hypothetical protein